MSVAEFINYWIDCSEHESSEDGCTKDQPIIYLKDWHFVKVCVIVTMSFIFWYFMKIVCRLMTLWSSYTVSPCRIGFSDSQSFKQEYDHYIAYSTPSFFLGDWLNLHHDTHSVRNYSKEEFYNDKISCSDYRFVYMGQKGSSPE